MALSPRQRMQVVDDISAAISELSGTSKPRQKMQIIENIDNLLAKLTGKAIETVKSLFQEIAQGIHDALGAVEVFKKIKAEIDRIGEDVIAFDIAINDQLKAACVKNGEQAETEGLFA